MLKHELIDIFSLKTMISPFNRYQFTLCPITSYGLSFKKEVDLIFDLDQDLYQDLMNFSKKIATALKKAVPCERIGMSVIGLEVPHAHVHLIPINSMKDVSFKNKVKLETKDFEILVDQIKSFL